MVKQQAPPPVNGLAIVALGVIVYALNRKQEEPPGSEPPPPTPANPIAGEGGVNFISTTPGGSQPVLLPAGSLFTADIYFEAWGVDLAGNILPWSFRWEVRLGHSTTFGWREAPGSPVAVRYDNVTLGPNRLQVNFTTPNDPGVTYDIHVKMFGARSSVAGTPLDSWYMMHPEVKLDGAIRVLG